MRVFVLARLLTRLLACWCVGRVKRSKENRIIRVRVCVCACVRVDAC